MIAIEQIRKQLIIDGITYERINGQEYEMKLFEKYELVRGINQTLAVENTIYEELIIDLELERSYAKELNARDDI